MCHFLKAAARALSLKTFAFPPKDAKISDRTEAGKKQREEAKNKHYDGIQFLFIFPLRDRENPAENGRPWGGKLSRESRRDYYIVKKKKRNRPLRQRKVLIAF